ncbi:MAG TPA: AHH domain-containing protein [Euzebya sp.]|nr:AHH domain-containing protein [Euzebya sp.]
MVGLVPVLGDIAKGAKGVDAVGDAVRAADDVADAADTAVDAGRAADDVAGGTRPGRIADDALSPEELAQRNADRARRGSSNSRDAAILEDNMATIDGITKPPGHEAHHIVPPRHPAGEGVRDILDELGVPYNHEANGVHLPGPHIDAGGAAPHRRVHTNRSYEELEDRLSHATTAEEAQEILRQAGQELSDGTFPY